MNREITMFRVLLHVGLTLLYALLLAFPVQWLWNHFVPGCLPLPLRPIDFWEAMGVVALGRLLHALRLLGFLLNIAVAAVLGGWLLQWAWNHWLVPGFGLGTLTWLQAGGLMALLQLVLGSGHAWFRWRHPLLHRLGHAYVKERCREHKNWHNEQRQAWREEKRRRKEEWKAWKEELKAETKGWSEEWKREGRRWKDMAEDAAPLGSHRHWKHFDRFWKERGKESFETWLREKGIGQ